MTTLQVIGQGALLFVAALMAGALNSVAGGGSFISTPALLSVNVPLLNSNATNTMSLWPGTMASAGAYRDRFGTVPRGMMILLIIVSLIGGDLGARLLLKTPNDTLSRLFPFLFLIAVSLFTFGNTISTRLRQRMRRNDGDTPTRRPTWLIYGGVAVLQIFIAVYGGYFGGGIGIMMLAALSLTGMEDIHTMNALKTLLASCINGTAVLEFVRNGTIWWPQAAIMIVAAIIGGYGGAYYARKIDPKIIRYFVIVVGYSLTAYYFLHPPT